MDIFKSLRRPNFGPSRDPSLFDYGSNALSSAANYATNFLPGGGGGINPSSISSMGNSIGSFFGNFLPKSTQPQQVPQHAFSGLFNKLAGGGSQHPSAPDPYSDMSQPSASYANMPQQGSGGYGGVGGGQGQSLSGGYGSYENAPLPLPAMNFDQLVDLNYYNPQGAQDYLGGLRDVGLYNRGATQDDWQGQQNDTFGRERNKFLFEKPIEAQLEKDKFDYEGNKTQQWDRDKFDYEEPVKNQLAIDKAKAERQNNPDQMLKLNNEVQETLKKKTALNEGVAFLNKYDPRSNNNTYSDNQLIYAYMKVMDPTSVVRESEFDTAQKAQGIVADLQSTFGKAGGNGILTPEARQHIVDIMKNTYFSKTGEMNNELKSKDYLIQKMGYQPSDIYDTKFAYGNAFDRDASQISNPILAQYGIGDSGYSQTPSYSMPDYGNDNFGGGSMIAMNGGGNDNFSDSGNPVDTILRKYNVL